MDAANTPDSFALMVLFLFMCIVILVGAQISKNKAKKRMENTIASGSRDPRAHLANQQNKAKLEFLLLVFALFLLYFFISKFF